jgi:hypothetical protein
LSSEFYCERKGVEAQSRKDLKEDIRDVSWIVTLFRRTSIHEEQQPSRQERRARKEDNNKRKPAFSGPSGFFFLNDK